MEHLREWAARDGFAIQMVRGDVGSGRRVVRPGAEAIMAEARSHHIHTISVAKVDRWARSLQHRYTTVNELRSLGVDFIAVDQGDVVRKGDPTAKLILHLLASCAEWEASIISERTGEGLRDKIGKRRHRRGCGEAFPGPTNRHSKKGISKETLGSPPLGGLGRR